MIEEVLGQQLDSIRRGGSESPASQAPLRQLLEKLPVGAYICDASGLITYFNRNAERLWGRTPKLNHAVDRFCGSHRLYSPDGSLIPHNQCWMAMALQMDKEIDGEEIVIEREDGASLHRPRSREPAS